MNEPNRPPFKFAGRVMPRTPLPAAVQFRMNRFHSMCSLARFIRTPYIASLSPPIWVEWANRTLCWRHRGK